MSFEIKVPSVGESITSAVVAQWHRKSGDAVAKGDLLLTLETDKVSTELAAEEAGVLEIAVPEGEEVEIGAVVGYISGNAEGSGSGAAPPPAKPAREEAETESPAAETREPVADESEQAAVPPPEREIQADHPEPAPAGAAQPLTVVRPEAPAEAPAAATEVAGDDGGRTTRRRMSPLRRKIATQLVNAQQTAAILTTFNECDMSAVMALRKDIQESFVARHGVKLGFMSFFIKAVVQALRDVPQVNARIDGDFLVENHFYDIGVAVGTERGLIVPVVRDCDAKGFADLERSILDFAARAKEGRIELSDLQGGVFTISNGGVYGSLLSTPILNPPQSGILGMHAIQQRPVAVNGKVEIRPMMYLALSYDHRVIDGKEAVTFLIRVKECIEQPTRLLLGA